GCLACERTRRSLGAAGSEMTRSENHSSGEELLKPVELKRLARVPYGVVVGWLTVGHPRAGVLPSIDLAAQGKRHSFRVRRADWEAFLARLRTVPREQQQARPQPRPETARNSKKGMFRY